MDMSKIEEYIEPILKAIGGLERSQVAIISSGNGIHFLVYTDVKIESEEYFEDNKAHYVEICRRVNRA